MRVRSARNDPVVHQTTLEGFRTMYYMLECQSPPGQFRALVDYRDPDPDRSWNVGERFFVEPELPIRARLRMRPGSVLIELWDVPLPLMTKRLFEALTRAGVSNLDVYPAELIDPASGLVYRDHLAFNLVGAIAAADLGKSVFSALDGGMISVDFDSLHIDEQKVRGALMFRLAESVNGIVVHESVRARVEQAGINTLTFIDPEDWVG